MRAVTLLVILILHTVFADPVYKTVRDRLVQAQQKVYECFISKGLGCEIFLAHLIDSCVFALRFANIRGGFPNPSTMKACRCFTEVRSKLESKKVKFDKLTYCVFKTVLKEDKGIDILDSFKVEVLP